MYSNITLCPKCGDITEQRCCGENLILYESPNINFLESIIPLYEEMNNVQATQRLLRTVNAYYYQLCNAIVSGISNQIYY